MTKAEYEKKLSAIEMKIVDGVGWTLHTDSGSLCKVNLDNQMVEYGAFVGVEKHAYNPSFISPNFIGDKALFAPCFLTGELFFLLVDLKTNEYVRVYIENRDIPKEFKSHMLFFPNAYVYKEYFYFVGCSYPAIIKFNTKDYSIEYIDGFVRMLEKERLNTLPDYFYGSSEVINGNMYLPSHKSKGIFKISCENGRTTYYPLNIKSEGLMELVKLDDCRVAVGGCGNNSDYVIVWNYIEERVEREINLCGFKKETDARLFMCVVHNELYIFSRYYYDNKNRRQTSIFRLGQANIIEQTDILDEYNYASAPLDNEPDFLFVGKKDEDTILFVTNGDYRWHEYNVITGRQKSYCVEIDKPILKKSYYDAIHSAKGSDCIFYERNIELDSFVSIV